MAKRVQINDAQNLVLNDEIYEASIIPKNKLEMWKKVTLKGACKIGGGVFCNSLQVETGPCDIEESVFIREEAAFNLGNSSRSSIKGCIQAERSILINKGDDLDNSKLIIEGDIYTDTINADSAFVYGNIFCNSAIVTNSVILGSIYASKKIEIKNSIVGMFATRTIELKQGVSMLQPTAICENKPVFKTPLYYVLLDDNCLPQYTFAIDDTDVVENSDVEEYGNSFVVPNYTIGIGNRLVNMEKLQDCLLTSANALASKYLQSNTKNRNHDDELVWEEQFLHYARNRKELNYSSTFSLSDYSLPAALLGTVKEDERIEEAEEYVKDESDVTGDTL